MAEKPFGFNFNQPLIAFLVGIVALGTVAFNGAAWVVEQGHADSKHDAAIGELREDIATGDAQIRQEMTDAINRGRAVNEKVAQTLESIQATVNETQLNVRELQTVNRNQTLTGQITRTLPDITVHARPQN